MLAVNYLLNVVTHYNITSNIQPVKNALWISEDARIVVLMAKH